MGNFFTKMPKQFPIRDFFSDARQSVWFSFYSVFASTFMA